MDLKCNIRKMFKYYTTTEASQRDYFKYRVAVLPRVTPATPDTAKHGLRLFFIENGIPPLQHSLNHNN